MRITKADKLKFWGHYKHVPMKEFVKLAREEFGYSLKTIDRDIYDSFTRTAWKEAKAQA